jgi:hypothetical protein
MCSWKNKAQQKLGAKQNLRKPKQERFKANNAPERQVAKQKHDITS